MFNTLLESRAQRAKRKGSTTASALLHGAIITSLIAFSSTGRGIAAPVPAVTPIRLVPLTRVKTPPAPTSHSSAVSERPSPEATRHVDIEIPDITPVGIPPIDVGRPAIGDGPIVIGSRGSADTGAELRGSTDFAAVHDAAFVDRAPSVRGNALAPRYPAALRASGTEGHVIVRFVVDTSGRAEMDGLTVREASHPLFADAVRNALGAYRFTPGEVAGRKVRTMVEMPFTFSLR